MARNANRRTRRSAPRTRAARRPTLRHRPHLPVTWPSWEAEEPPASGGRWRSSVSRCNDAGGAANRASRARSVPLPAEVLPELLREMDIVRHGLMLDRRPRSGANHAQCGATHAGRQTCVLLTGSGDPGNDAGARPSASKSWRNRRRHPKHGGGTRWWAPHGGCHEDPRDPRGRRVSFCLVAGRCQHTIPDGQSESSFLRPTLSSSSCGRRMASCLRTTTARPGSTSAKRPSASPRARARSRIRPSA